MIATYGRGAQLCSLLKQLTGQSLQPDEIIIVDQTPQYPPEIAERLKSFQQRNIHYIRQSDISVSKARNLGALKSTADILIFIDDDVVLGNNFVQNHLKNYIDETIDGVGGQVLNNDDPQPMPIIAKELFAFPYGYMHFPTSSSISAVTQTLVGTNFSIRRNLYLAIGGFDENLCYAEDMDFSFRLQGHRLIFAPEASLFHLRLSQGGMSYLDVHSYLKPTLYYQSLFYCYLRNYFIDQPLGTIWLILKLFRVWILNKHNLRRPLLLMRQIFHFVMGFVSACCLLLKKRKLISK